jgi:predicted nucleotidyltransferase
MMLNVSMLETELRLILIGLIEDLQAAYLFGSAATGGLRPESDLDIAILMQNPLSSRKLYELSEKIAQGMGRDVDLIDLRSATTVLQMQVLSTGKRIICNDALEVDSFEDRVFSDYARLNEERSGILEDIRERGSIYGG